MYEMPDFPAVPRLVFINHESESDYMDKPYDEDGRSKKLKYSLDWKPKEKGAKKRFDKFKFGQNGKEFKKCEVFPEEYLQWLYDLRFEMPYSYLKEIGYQTKRGVEEWSRHFPDNYTCSMDTAVREYCLKPAKSHFDVAFYLLSDCTMFENKSYLYRRVLVNVALVMYFWEGQTGAGLITTNSKFDKLKEMYDSTHDRKSRLFETLEKSEDEFILNFIKLVEKNLK